jgi:hypothetical protein
MNMPLNRRLIATALLALSSASAFAEREISCVANSHIVNEIRKIELRLDLPNSSRMPGYAQFIRGPGQSALSAPIYASELSIAPSNDEERFFWNESATGSANGISRTYELELVKKEASKKASAKWAIRGYKSEKTGSEFCHDGDAGCGWVKTVAFEAPIECTDSYDRIVADSRSQEERCKDDPYHCQN